MMEDFYCDIETIPCQDVAMCESLRADADEALVSELAEVKAPGNYKDADKIAAYIEDARSKMLKEHDAIRNIFLSSWAATVAATAVCVAILAAWPN